jgi:hypothetical protein
LGGQWPSYYLRRIIMAINNNMLKINIAISDHQLSLLFQSICFSTR